MRFKRKLTAVLLATTLVGPLLPCQAWAATGLIYITPGNSSLQVGNSETLSLRITPGTTVDGVQATVSYNPGTLQLNGVDTSASPFSVQLQKSAGGGTITAALGSLSGGVSSDALIATMNFTALAGSGSSSLVVSNANATNSGAYTNPASSGASISFTSPAVGGSGGGSSSGSSTSHDSGGNGVRSGSSSTGAVPSTATTMSTGAVAPPVQATAAKLKSQLTKAGMTSATLNVSSNQSLNLYALYGTDANQLSSKTAVANGSTRADLTLGQGGTLEPGTTYFYQIVGEDAAGNVTMQPVQHFTTAGFTVHVTVLDGQNKLLGHIKVTLHSHAQTVMTDDHGTATFTGVAPGLHHLDYQVGGRTYSSAVYVENQKTPVQAAAVVLPLQPVQQASSGSMAGLIVASGLVLFLAGVEIFRHPKQFKHQALKLVATGRAFLF